MSDLEIIIGGVVSSFAVGWALGYGVKIYRRFFDAV